MKKPTIQTFLIQVQIRFFLFLEKNVHHIHLCLLNVVPGINVLQRKNKLYESQGAWNEAEHRQGSTEM